MEARNMPSLRLGAVAALAAAAVLLLVARGPRLGDGVRAPGEARTAELLQASLWDNIHISRSLCATQAVKLPDCAPRPAARSSVPAHSKYSPYLVHGKAVPWKTVQQVVRMHPKTVTKKVLARTQAIRQHLDSIEASEVIREEAVKQQQRRLKAAKARIALLLKAAAKQQQDAQDGAGRGAGRQRRRSAGGGAGRDKSVPASVVSAMAMTMEAEQREISHLRRRLRAIQKVQGALHSPTSAASPAGTHPAPIFGNATTSGRALGSQGDPGGEGQGKHAGLLASNTNMTELAAEVATMIRGKVQPAMTTVTTVNPRAAEDAELARKGAHILKNKRPDYTEKRRSNTQNNLLILKRDLNIIKRDLVIL
jgi:hypothetical protein